MFSNILIMLLVLFLIGGIPRWRYSRAWGYGPSSIIGLILVIYLVSLVLGFIPPGL